MNRKDGKLGRAEGKSGVARKLLRAGSGFTALLAPFLCCFLPDSLSFPVLSGFLDPRPLHPLTSSAHLEESSNEAILSASEQAPNQQTRIPGTDGHALGARSALAATEKGPQAAHCVTPLQARGLLTAAAGLPRSHRLARASDLRRCLTEGRRRRLENLDVFWMDNSTGHPRMGLIVPKFQYSAVARNRVRRRLREIWRREIQAQQPEWDLVIKARTEAYDATFEALRTQLLGWRDAFLTT